MSRHILKQFTSKAALVGLLLICGCEMPQLQPLAVESYLQQIQSAQPFDPGKPETMDPNTAQSPLTLLQCQSIALANNPLEEAARMGVAAARATVGQARSAYYPTLDATAAYSRWQQRIFLPEGLTRPGISSTVGPTDDWSASLNAHYVLYDSGRRRAELLTALAEQEANTRQWHQTREDLALNVHSAFYSYLAALDARQIAEQDLKRVHNHLELAQHRNEVGAIPYAEVIRIKVDVSDARLTLVRAESTVTIARSRLNTAMGLPAGMPLTVRSDPDPVMSPDENLLTAALRRAPYLRSDIQAGLYEISAAKSSVDVAKTAYGPSISGRAQFGRQDDQFFPKDDDWLAGIFLELPLFDGRARDSRLARAKAQLAQEEAHIRSLLLQARQEVWESYSRLKEAYEAVQATETLVDEAQESMRLTQERYEVGEATTNDLLDSRTALVRAEGNSAQVQWEYHIAMAHFHRASGTLLSQESM